MDLQTYKNIVAFIRNHQGLPRKCLEDAREKFPDLTRQTLTSLHRLTYQRLMAIHHIKTEERKDMMWEDYQGALKAREAPGILLRLSEQTGIAPCLVARMILEKFLDIKQEAKEAEEEAAAEANQPKEGEEEAEMLGEEEEVQLVEGEEVQLVEEKEEEEELEEEKLEELEEEEKLEELEEEEKLEEEEDSDDEDDDDLTVNDYLENTESIPDMDLSYEVYLCTLHDNVYSPGAEVARQSLGQQYEIRLHNEAIKLGLAFKGEAALKKSGYDKTPDIKLQVPVAVGDHLITWIESKAMFGDEIAHKEYMKAQYNSYLNRFGPGLVIYWFGYLKTVAEDNKDILIMDHLPETFQTWKGLEETDEEAADFFKPDSFVFPTECLDKELEDFNLSLR